MEGGMVNTNSKELMETLVSIRAHGWTRGLELNNSVHPKSNNEWDDLFRFVLPGYNLRPIELSGAIGKVQLRKFGGSARMATNGWPLQTIELQVILDVRLAFFLDLIQIKMVSYT